MRATSSRVRKASSAFCSVARTVTVDDEIEHRVQDVVRAVFEEIRRSFEVLAKVAMAAGRAVSDRDDVVAADEHRGLAIANLAIVQVRGASHDEQLVAIDVHLRHLVRLQRVFDR